MNCNDVNERLADLLLAPDEVNAEVRSQLDGHLAGCTECSGQLKELRATMALMDAWEAPEPNPYFLTRLNARLDEERAAVGFYLSGHPLESMMEVLRRKRTTMFTDALAQVEEGMEAFRMAGVVRRRQERASARSGDKFAFVTLSDPTGEYEVLFPPESLRRCREALEPGKAVVIKVRAKASDGDVRFFGDEAEPLERAIVGATAGLRVHLSPATADMEGLRRRLRPADGAGSAGEIILIAGVGEGREVELKLPGRFSLDPAVRGALKTAPGVAFLEEV